MSKKSVLNEKKLKDIHGGAAQSETENMTLTAEDGNTDTKELKITKQSSAIIDLTVQLPDV